jgi:hypothetical protein
MTKKKVEEWKEKQKKREEEGRREEGQAGFEYPHIIY